MGKLKLAFSVFGLAFVVYLAVAFVSPKRADVKYSFKIYANPSAVFARVVCMNEWKQWQSMQKLDPDLNYEFSDRPCGLQAWGELTSKNLGHARFEIREVRPDRYVSLTADIESVDSDGLVEWWFEEDGYDTKVEYVFTGSETSFFFRPFNWFSSNVLEELMLKDLKALKILAEETPNFVLRTYEYLYEVEEVVLPDSFYLLDFANVTLKEADSIHIHGSATIEKITEINGANLLGPREFHFYEGDSIRTVASAIPVAPGGVQFENLAFQKIKGGKAFQIRSNHAYIDEEVNSAIQDYMEDRGLNWKMPVRTIFDKEGHPSDTSGWSVRVVYPLSD